METYFSFQFTENFVLLERLHAMTSDQQMSHYLNPPQYIQLDFKTIKLQLLPTTASTVIQKLIA